MTEIVGVIVFLMVLTVIWAGHHEHCDDCGGPVVKLGMTARMCERCGRFWRPV